ncbi:AAA family ATPase, partial [Serratia sp. Ag2]|uniref:ATP-binding protein n=1 Tax=Serratia sp. Ag2 TaxID=1532556 RepID=UPI00055CCCC7
EAALSDLVQRLRATRAGLTPDNGPQGVFLLVGPSGVGKTETALALADTLFGGEASLMRITPPGSWSCHRFSAMASGPNSRVNSSPALILHMVRTLPPVAENRPHWPGIIILDGLIQLTDTVP